MRNGKAWAGLALPTLPTVLVALDMNVLFLALPHLTADLHASGVQQLWISDVYGLVVGVLVIVMGAVGDRVGRRRLLTIGCSMFGLASLLAAFAPSAGVLIGARVVQGVAGATLAPSTLALIGTLFPDSTARGRAISIWATCQFSGAALGPVFGGVLLQRWWWGSVFLIAVPICGLVVLLGPALLPEHEDAAHAPAIDVTSAALAMGTLLSLLFAIKSLVPGSHVSRPVVLVAAVVAVMAGTAFVRRQLRSADPFLDLALLRTPAIRATIVGLVLAGVAMAGVGLWATQYLQSVLGYSPLVAAVVFAPMGLGVAVGTLCAPRLARWVDTPTLVAAGLAVAAAGAALLTLVQPDRSVLVLVAAYTVLAAGTGPLFALGTARLVASAPAARAGRAAGLSETGNYLGGTLGVAVLGSLAGAVYTHALGGHVLPTLTAAQRATALQNMASAHAIAQQTHAAGLLAASADSATSALHVIGIAGLVVFAAAAATMVRTRRPVPVESSPSAVVG